MLRLRPFRVVLLLASQHHSSSAAASAESAKIDEIVGRTALSWSTFFSFSAEQNDVVTMCKTMYIVTKTSS